MVPLKMRQSSQNYRDKNRKWCFSRCWGGKNRKLVLKEYRFLVAQEKVGSGDRWY